MAKKKKVELREKQKAFIREYLIDFNATAAAERAGYSKKTARIIGAQNLTKLNIQAEIQAEIKKRADAAGLTADRIWQEWRRIGLADLGDILDFSGPELRLKPANQIPEDARRAIASMKVKRYVEGHGDDAKTVEVIEIKLWDKPGVLRDAAKARVMFKEKVELTGREGKPIKVIEIVRSRPKAN